MTWANVSLGQGGDGENNAANQQQQKNHPLNNTLPLQFIKPVQTCLTLVHCPPFNLLH